jgi:hypothetical protein
VARLEVLAHIVIDDRRGATGRLEGKVRDVGEILRKTAAQSAKRRQTVNRG